MKRMILLVLLLCGTIYGDNFNQLPSKLYSYTQFPIEGATLAVTNGGPGCTIALDTTELSPLNGNSSIKVVCPSGQLNRVSLVFGATQTIYPNTCLLIKLADVGGTGKLNDLNCYPTVYFGEDADHYKTETLDSQRAGNLSNTGEWQLYPIVRSQMEVTGTPASWATTEANQGFELTRMRFMFSSPSENVTFYIGGVVTLNAPKAKLIMTWDTPHQSVIDEVLPRTKAKGWPMVNAVPTDLNGTGADIINIQKLYDAGWDIVSHSASHTDPDDLTNAQTLADYGTAKQWLRSQGWPRGNDFACYAFRRIGGTLTLTAGDYCERILTMGRGKGLRAIYGSTGVKSPLNTYNPQVIFDLLNITDFYSTSDGSSAGVQNDVYTSIATLTMTDAITTPPNVGEILTQANTGATMTVVSASTPQITGNITGTWNFTDVVTTDGVMEPAATNVPTALGLGMKETLAQSVLHKGVLVPFGHRIDATPAGAEEASPAWLEAFLADVQTYVDAGTLEVITMTDWHNELYGTEPFEEPKKSDIRGRYNEKGRYN